MSDLKLNTHYEFSTYAASVLGSNYTSVMLTGIVNYQTAIKYDNIEAKNKQVYPFLPEGTIKDHTQYTYYLFKHKGQNLVMADYWIVTDTLKEVNGSNYNITIKSPTNNQIALIRDQLSLIGVIFEIE